MNVNYCVFGKLAALICGMLGVNACVIPPPGPPMGSTPAQICADTTSDLEDCIACCVSTFGAHHVLYAQCKEFCKADEEGEAAFDAGNAFFVVRPLDEGSTAGMAPEQLGDREPDAFTCYGDPLSVEIIGLLPQFMHGEVVNEFLCSLTMDEKALGLSALEEHGRAIGAITPEQWDAFLNSVEEIVVEWLCEYYPEPEVCCPTMLEYYEEEAIVFRNVVLRWTLYELCALVGECPPE